MSPQDGFMCLPQQLLVQMLQRVPTRDRLLNCAVVCSAWRDSAAQATSEIAISCRPFGDQNKCKALTDWLLKHGDAAAVDSITVVGESHNTVDYSHPLLLPIEQLSALRKLNVDRFSVAAVPSSEVAAATGSGAPLASRASTEQRHAAPVLLPQLSTLTHLGLHYCFAQLAALSAFTNLQRLELIDLRYGQGPPFGYDLQANVTALQQALPKLQLLTWLELGCRFTSDPVLAAIQHLTRLQHLEMVSSICSEAAFAAGALPALLTRLRFEGVVGTNERTLSPSSTPGLTQLTALRSLAVGSVRLFDAALLRALTRLSDLYVLNCRTAPAGLSAIASLTELVRLSLNSYAPPQAPAGSAADVAALTASSKLTHLGIGDKLVKPEQYIHMLPAGRTLPQLQSLCATRSLLSDVATVDRLVLACPELRELHLTRADVDEPGAGTAEDDDSGFERHSWASLMSLTKLTALSLNLDGMRAPEVDWMWLGYVSSLRRLDVGQIGWSQIGGILELTGCRGLTSLKLRFQSVAGILQVPGAEHIHVELKNQAPEGLPPDVWCQLPYAILTAAKRRLSNTDPLEALGEHVEGAIKEVMHKATDFLWSFAELHRTQQQELRQQLIGVQAELAQQREQWQQEVAGLKGSLAAMAAQLQAMQQQLQQQQPGH